MRALGATPQALPFSEAYNALANHAVDGTENPPSNLYTKKMYEVQKHVTESDHGYLGYAVIVNKKFWDELPRDIRRELESALKDATNYATTSRAWKRALIGVHRDQEARIGKEIVAEFYEAAGFNPGKP